MDTSQSKVITSVTIAPTLLSRVDAYAEAEERSRSYVVTKALEQFLQNSAEIGPAERGLDGECPFAKNPVTQRRDCNCPSRLVDPSTGAPAASVGAFQIAHAARQNAVKKSQEAALSDARDQVLVANRNYFKGNR